ncbi:MAG TPA: 1,6-anhydro-N-acetylmuramyl-L-alanine amidase AmpD [Thermoanaerobaculia bacterium]|jgi:AmpD protein|nr:1,6-anhydro-N-acetylmuramyl-L-alanine amidase AmpD [Thermoanaerobaculia bacterium]
MEKRRSPARRANPEVSPEGWLSGASRVPSPNCDDRPLGSVVRLLVIHAISLPPGEFGGEAVLDFFTNRLDPAGHSFFATIADLKVSAHFFIRRGGELIQLVPCAKRAWHAGVSSWRGRDACNDFSLGVELEGCDDRRYTGKQYLRLARLTRALQSTYPIEEIVGHSDIAPGRKTDPGPCFDWQRYRRLL